MSENTPRLAGYLDKTLPGLYQALSGYAEQVTAEADRTGIPRRTLELVNYRASQINGCAFCLDLHHRRAIGYGEVELFSDAEKVALELAEQITRMSSARPTAELFSRARRVYSEEQISVLCMACIGINAFNRLSILSEHPVRKARS